ncbi:uncharacterized protein LOC144790958 [Lissotriton helveticus]
MKCFKWLRAVFKKEKRGSYEGEEAPPEGTPARYMAVNVGLHTILWISEWSKITEGNEELTFPKYGTFRLEVLHRLKSVMTSMRPLPRPTQFEALEAWIRAAHEKNMNRRQERVKRSVRAVQDARWDADAKRWRVHNMEVNKLYPVLEVPENKSPLEEDDESETEDSLINRLLTDRPPPYNRAGGEVGHSEGEKGGNAGEHGPLPSSEWDPEAKKELSQPSQVQQVVGRFVVQRAPETKCATSYTLPDALQVPVTIGPIISIYDQERARGEERVRKDRERAGTARRNDTIKAPSQMPIPREWSTPVHPVGDPGGDPGGPRWPVDLRGSGRKSFQELNEYMKQWDEAVEAHKSIIAAEAERESQDSRARTHCGAGESSPEWDCRERDSRGVTHWARSGDRTDLENGGPGSGGVSRPILSEGERRAQEYRNSFKCPHCVPGTRELNGSCERSHHSPCDDGHERSPGNMGNQEGSYRILSDTRQRESSDQRENNREVYGERREEEESGQSKSRGNRPVFHHLPRSDGRAWDLERWEQGRAPINSPEPKRRARSWDGRETSEPPSKDILRAEIKAKRLDVASLRSDLDDMVDGTLPLERMEMYEQDEILYMAKDITRKARAVHEKLVELAGKYMVDLSRTKALQGNHRLHYTDRDLDERRTIGLKTHIRELIAGIRTWRALDKWEERWSKKGTGRRSTLGMIPGRLQGTEAYPLREVANGNYVHVPWSRGDLAAFTTSFPKLRENPVEWLMWGTWFGIASQVAVPDLEDSFASLLKAGQAVP